MTTDTVERPDPEEDLAVCGNTGLAIEVCDCDETHICPGCHLDIEVCACE